MSCRVVYTASFGGYDRLRQPRVLSPNTNYYYLTDKVGVYPPPPWRIRNVPEGSGCPRDPIRRARWCKTHPDVLFPTSSMTVWLDGNIRLLTTVDELERLAFWQAYKRTSRMGLFSHPHRSCIYQEARACIAMHKGDPAVIEAQMERYRQEGYPTFAGLVATGVLVRQTCPEMDTFNHHWWYEIQKGSLRDQLSFNYVARKRKERYGVIPGSIFDSPLVRVAPHL